MHLIIDLEANKVYFTPLMHLSPDGALLSVPKRAYVRVDRRRAALRHASVGVPARIFLVSLSPTPITEIGPSLLLLRSSLLT